jgi:hypothetical protein
VRRQAPMLAMLAASAATAMLVSIGTAGAGQPSPVQLVREQNVDAQGNIKVSEQGTPQVSLTGDPRVGLDPNLGNTVKIDSNANTVKIDTAGSGPIQTQAADNPAFTPVVVTTPVGSAVNTLYTVPPHEVLVIQEFSAETISPLYPDPGLRYVYLNTPSKFALALTSPASDRISIGSMQTTIYVQPGADVTCSLLTNPDDGFCSISGYLVPVK